MASELLEFPGGLFGVALNLDEDSIGAVIMGEGSEIQEGDPEGVNRLDLSAEEVQLRARRWLTDVPDHDPVPGSQPGQLRIL